MVSILVSLSIRCLSDNIHINILLELVWKTSFSYITSFKNSLISYFFTFEIKFYSFGYPFWFLLSIRCLSDSIPINILLELTWKTSFSYVDNFRTNLTTYFFTVLRHFYLLKPYQERRLLCSVVKQPCPFTGRKMFCAGPNFLCRNKNLFTYCASHKHFVPYKKMICIQ